MRWIIGFLLLFVIVAISAWKSESLVLKALDWRTPNTTLAEHQAFLSNHITVLTPSKGTAPYPTVIQFHGCAGMRREFHETWAQVANDAGYAAVLVDSNRARAIGFEESLQTICEGKTLIGQERAGDILAAVSYAANDPRLDMDKLILAGWSHGAWTVMDFLTMDMKGARPANLSNDALIKPDIDGAILFYPHCGRGALSRVRSWTQDISTLAFIAGKDSIVEPKPCIDFFAKQKADGKSTELIVYPEADHIFDDASLYREDPKYYHEASAKDAAIRYETFLNQLHD